MQTEEIRLTDDPQVTLTTYLLDQSAEFKNIKTRPAVLILPGGGYAGLSDREAEPVAMAFLAEGYNAFILRYSLREKAVFPRPLNDAELALDCIRAHSAAWHVDPDRIAALGFSAGGHLAAMLGAAGRVRPNALLLGYPCILSSIGDVLFNPVPSCTDYVDQKTPPAFLFATREDDLVPIKNTLAFADALEAAGLAFELHIFEKGIHGLSLAKGMTSSGYRQFYSDDFAQWFGLGVRWLRQHFGDFRSDRDFPGWGA